MGTNTPSTTSAEVQTDTRDLVDTAEVDDVKLAAWLKRIYPQVKKELDDVATAKAFKGYRTQISKASDASFNLLHVANFRNQITDPEIGANVSSMCWNSTNQTLALTCTFNHKSWCYHEGLVLVFSLKKDDKFSDLPSHKLQPESCVMHIQFHPVMPAILAGGLYSGAIIIWNVQNSDEEEILVKFSGHGDGITQLSWIYDFNSSKNIQLASSSLDGHLTMWDYNSSEKILTPIEKHQIKSPILPKATEGAVYGKNAIRAITCFDFSKHKRDAFVIGAEGGLIVQCSLLGSTKLSGTSSLPIVDSIYKYYEPHKGELTAISFSPNRNDMFLSCGTDLEIRIYMIDQEEPAKVIFVKTPLLCVRWVPYEEKIIVGCGSNGFLEVFHLIKGEQVVVTKRDKVAVAKLTDIQINTLKSNLMAVGTDDGHVQLWRIPWNSFA